MKIMDKDLQNPQRFIAEGLGAPEAIIMEAKAQRRAGRIHCLCSKKQWA